MINDDNKTLWCGNLSEQVTEELLYELFLQAGPLEKVRIAKDKDGRQKNFAFITYCHEESVPYAINLFRGTALFHRTLALQCRDRSSTSSQAIRPLMSQPGVDFGTQSNVVQQFSDMTQKLNEEVHKSIYAPRQTHDLSDKLVLASLQGNWTHRHHPYRPDKLYGRSEYNNRDMMPDRHNYDNYKGHNHNKHSGSWRDRRNHKKSYNHRRD